MKKELEIILAPLNIEAVKRFKKDIEKFKNGVTVVEESVTTSANALVYTAWYTVEAEKPAKSNSKK